MPKDPKMIFAVTKEMRRQAKIKAAELGISISDVLRRMVQEWLDENGGEESDDGHKQRRTHSGHNQPAAE